MEDKTKEVTVETEPKQCKPTEVIGHAVGVLGHDSAYTLWYQWVTPFITDILQIPGTVMAGLLAAMRIFDGVNDVMMGFVADKTKSKFGRFRPWLLRAGPLFCIIMACTFILPPTENMLIRTIFACVMYVAVDVSFTAVDIPFWSLPSAMTSNPKERATIIGTTTTVSNAISAIIGVAMPVALVALGEFKWTSYFFLALGVGIFATIMYLISFATVREHVVPENQEHFSLKLGIKNIYQNKPLLMLQLSNFAIRMGMIMRGSFNYYYFTYCVGDMRLMSIMSLISLFTGILGSLLFTVLTRFIGKKTFMFVGTIVTTASQVVIYFTGWTNIVALFICAGITSTFLGALFVCINAMLADTIEYGEYLTGQRDEGLINSTRCFISKICTAIAGGAALFILGFTHYVPGAEVQTVDVMSSIHTVYTLVSAGIVVLAIIPIFFYDLTEKKHAEIVEKLAARKAGKE